MSTYYERNKEKIKERHRIKYEVDEEYRSKRKAQSSHYYKLKRKTDAAFKEKVNAQSKKYREENRESFREMQKDWMKRNPNYYFLNNARSRAKQFNLPFELKIADINALTIPDVCPYLGIPIFKGKNSKSSENSPSLDRIVPSLGYVKGNVEFISSRANRLKNDASLKELEAIVKRLKTLLNQE